MRIVHINTFSSGGAGIAAKRLHTGLLNQGVESTFLSLGNTELIKHNLNYYQSLSTFPKLYFKILDNFSARKRKVDSLNEKLRLQNHTADFFSSPFAKFHLERHPVIKKADIIHLHWISGFIDTPTFFTKIKKPIVWTLHDMNPFMGGFHYAEDKKRNYNALKDLEDMFLNLKKNAIQHFKNDFQIISPSTWLAETAKASKVFSEKKIHIIPNGIEIYNINIDERMKIKTELGLSTDKKIILFLADSVTDKRKGFDLLIEALKDFQQKDVLLITVGSNKIVEEIKVELKQLGKIKDENLLIKIITAADVVLIPSREDNLPNVMLEAFSCGTPVIAFPVGGLAEHVKNGVNGILTDKISPHSLKIAIEQFIQTKNTFNRDKIKEYAENNFSINQISKQHIQIYKSLLY